MAVTVQRMTATTNTVLFPGLAHLEHPFVWLHQRVCCLAHCAYCASCICCADQVAAALLSPCHPNDLAVLATITDLLRQWLKEYLSTQPDPS